MLVLSLNSQASEASLAKLWQEVESTLGCSDDPLDILIAQEEETYHEQLTEVSTG